MALELAPGVWNFDKSENFDEYMKALDVGFPKRVLGNQARPRQEISIVDDVWTITTSTTLSKVEIKFKIGEPFDESTADGRKVKTTCTIDGTKLLQDQKGTIDSLLIRDFSKDQFVMTLKAKNAVCTRYYKKAE